MLGYDFSTFLLMGQAILTGSNPYGLPFAPYPPATFFLFAIFALVPYQIGFPVWTGLNIIWMWETIRSQPGKKWLWFLYGPVLFVLLTGQIDILFYWVACQLPKRGWTAVLAATFLTLKPQIAIVVLPWFLIKWMKQDHASLVRWFILALLLHLSPLIYDIHFYQKWFDSIQRASSGRMIVSSGVFALAVFPIPLVVLILLAAAILLWGLFHNEMSMRAAILASLPVSLWYDDIVLVGSAPWWLMIPWSLAAFFLSSILSSNVPLMTIPLVAIWWNRKQPFNNPFSLRISAGSQV